MAELQEEPTLNSFFKDEQSAKKIGWTNNVFKVEKENRILYFVPAYLRLKVKNIMSIDLFTLTGEVNCTFILSIFYSEMEEDAVEYLSKSVEIAFHKSDALKLDEENLEVIRKNDEKKKLLSFTIRKAIATRLYGEIFWSPFETIKFIISLTMRSLKAEIKGKEYMFKFNLMDCDNMDTKFSLSEETNFGIFKIAEKQLEVEYTNKFSYLANEKKFGRKIGIKDGEKLTIKSFESKKRESKEKLMEEEEMEPLTITQKTHNFHYAHFILPAYKKPNPAILTIYFPLLLLGIINIGIFYQDNTNTGKMVINLSALLVSFIALIPTVRENTAVSPVVTFTEILVFIESFTTILTLIHMVIYRNEDVLEFEIQSDGLLLASVIITCLVAACIFTLILLHKFKWKPQYHWEKKEAKEFKFNHKLWYNENCDRYFEDEVSGIEDHLVQMKEEKKESKYMRIESKEE